MGEMFNSVAGIKLISLLLSWQNANVILER